MKIEIYRAKDGWRWRLKARNGRIVAESGEAYQRRSACREMSLNLFYTNSRVTFPPPDIRAILELRKMLDAQPIPKRGRQIL